jgi:subtilisin family serine protease
MKRTLTFLLLILLCFSSFGLSHPRPPDKLSQRLWRVYQSARADDEFLVWIYFTDKGRHLSAKLVRTRQSLTAKSRQRRLTVRTVDKLVDVADLPVESRYLAAVQPHVRQFRHVSKWLNAVSARATKRQIDLIRTFDFVKAIDLVARFRAPAPEPGEPAPEAGPTSAGLAHGPTTLPFNYGPSLAQLNQINVPAVHNLGNFGQGVVIGVFDSGFNNLRHEAFQQMNLIAAHDFVNGDEDVGDGEDMGIGSHGTWVLSVIGGFAEGNLIGPAFAASYILAKTENDPGSETPREEDNWVAALEWAEGLGVDVISSSVGYLAFDPPFASYTWENMDGQTAVITRAAVMGVQRGVVIVNAAGNNGFNPAHNTLMAPADGDGVVAVGAVDLDGTRASFSSVGPTVDGRIKPDVMALGVSNQVASARSRREYEMRSGTSFACPLVAGVVALVLSAHPDWSPAQVLDALRRTASHATDPNNWVGWGIVDALAAVQFSP